MDLINIKDCKERFRTNQKCKLLNPTKKPKLDALANDF